MSTSPTNTEHEQVNSAPENIGLRGWFPFVWTGLVGGSAIFLQLGKADQDVKNFSLTVAIPLLVIGLSVWFIPIQLHLVNQHVG